MKNKKIILPSLLQIIVLILLIAYTIAMTFFLSNYADTHPGDSLFHRIIIASLHILHLALFLFISRNISDWFPSTSFLVNSVIQKEPALRTHKYELQDYDNNKKLKVISIFLTHPSLPEICITMDVSGKNYIYTPYIEICGRFINIWELCQFIHDRDSTKIFTVENYLDEFMTFLEENKDLFYERLEECELLRIKRMKTTESKKALYCLSLYKDRCFADICEGLNKTLYLDRISFEGFEPIQLSSMSPSLSEEESHEFSAEASKSEPNQSILRHLLLKLIHLNSDKIDRRIFKAYPLLDAI